MVANTTDLPASVTVLDLTKLCPGLTPEDGEIIYLRMLQTCAAAARIYCAPIQLVGRFFANFSAVLRVHHVTCYRCADNLEPAGDGPFIDPNPFEFLSEHIQAIDGFIGLDKLAVDDDCRRLPSLRQKVSLAHQPNR